MAGAEGSVGWKTADGVASFILSQLRRDDGRLLHSWRNGHAKLDAYLDDYAALANSLVTLYEANFKEQWIDEAVRRVRPDIIQFHGTESRELCESFGIRYVKTIGMGENDAVARTVAEHPNAVAYLLDSNKPGEQGGSGVTFDWSRIPTNLPKPFILAGGLTCDNVANAIRTARPFAVDVASGIESAPGIKDAEKMRRFIEEVKRASGDSQ